MQLFIKWLFLLCLFAPIIYFALRYKKWYLYLLVAFIAILPEQFSIRLHDQLPLLTASRILIVIAAVFWFIGQLKARKLTIPWSLLVFLGANMILSLIHLPSNLDEIKRIFLLIMERGLVVVMMMDMISDRIEFDRCVDFLILGCCAVAVIGIFQTIFNFDLAEPLQLVETASSIQLAQRMGLTRAYATMNAISYGCYCAFMVLPIYYRLQATGKQRYSIAFALNMVALIATFSRSAWLCFLGIAAIIFFTRPKKLMKAIWTGGVLVIALCLVFSLVQPRFGQSLVETGKSAFNTVLGVIPGGENIRFPSSTGDTTDTDEDQKPPKEEKPGFTLSEEFGENANNPTYSRTFQWSALQYMVEDGTLLLGNGYSALLRGKIHFIYAPWGNDWHTSTFVDVGLVSLIAEYGLVGLAIQMGLLVYLFVQAFRNRDRAGAFDFYKVALYTVPLYLLLNILAAFVNPGVLWLFIGLFYTYMQLDKKGILGITPPEPEQKWFF